MPATPLDTVIFDIGNVLIHWQPEKLVKRLAGDAERARRILRDVINDDFHRLMDGGISWAEGCTQVAARFPDYADVIHGFNEHWEDAVPGPIEGTLALFEELHAAGVPLYGLTNFSSEKYWLEYERFDFFKRFRDVLVSGDEKLLKPDPAIFLRLIERNGINAARTVFIDDSPKNVAGAQSVGLTALHFTGPEVLRDDLRALGLPVSPLAA